MAIVEAKCYACGAEIEASAAQGIYNGELVWNLGYTCPKCGSNLAEDGRGAPPDEIRRAILQQEGEWVLEVADTGKAGVLAMKLLRGALGLALPEIAKVLKRLPGPVALGTRAEMERLLAILSRENLHAFVVSRSATAPSDS